MFSHELYAIVKTLDPGRAPIPRTTASHAAQLERQAHRVLSNTLRSPIISERRSDPEAYQAIRKARRRDLEALIVMDPAPVLDRVVDLIYLIGEESRWAADGTEIFEDATHPDIDQQAADTAALFGWTVRLMEYALNQVSPRICQYMLALAYRRVIQPLIDHDDYVCPVSVVCAATTALILLEHDEGKLMASLRPLLRRIDAGYACGDARPAPLEERLADASAMADFAMMMKRMTAGAADFTAEIPYTVWLDELLFSYISDDWFFDCTGESLRPNLSGQALFRLGRMAGDDALCQLGAHLHRAHGVASPTVTGRLLDLMYLDPLYRELSPAPRLKHAAIENGRLLIARGAGFFCGMTSGGNKGNVGDICVFLDNTPVLTSNNLPLSQLARPAVAPEPDWDFSQEERAIIGVDVTPAYPAEIGILAHQRTLVLARNEFSAQLVDVFDLAKPIDMYYVFHSPFQPELVEGGAKLGPLLLLWEETLDTEIRFIAPTPDFQDGQWALRLYYPEVTTRAMYTFFLRHV